MRASSAVSCAFPAGRGSLNKGENAADVRPLYSTRTCRCAIYQYLHETSLLSRGCWWGNLRGCRHLNRQLIMYRHLGSLHSAVLKAAPYCECGLPFSGAIKLFISLVGFGLEACLPPPYSTICRLLQVCNDLSVFGQ